MSELPDHIILEKALTDKTRAFEIAFNQYWETLYIHACRKVRSEPLAKDLVQEVYLVLWNSLDELAGRTTLLPFLYAVLRNKVLHQYEKDSVRLRYALLHAESEGATALLSEEWLQHKELFSIVNAEIEKMPSRMRDIYMLRKEGALSIREIAERLQISEQTVKNQLVQAHTRLKQRLKDYK